MREHFNETADFMILVTPALTVVKTSFKTDAYGCIIVLLISKYMLTCKQHFVDTPC